MNDVEDQLEAWEELMNKAEKGEKVFAPKAKSTKAKKRKSSSPQRSRKRQKRTKDTDSDLNDFIDDGDDDSASTDGDEDNASDKEVDEADQVPLMEDRISSKITELRATKKEARCQRTELEAKIKDLQKQITEVEQAQQKIEEEISRDCIEGRNGYSKGAIQQDFASGIKELDQELAEEADEENFNPENEIRDYDEVARSLSVFCVSSRGYQKLKGRLTKDPDVPGFKAVEETEIPQLQEHFRKLTETGRTETCKRFLINFGQLLNSMTLWASSDGRGMNMSKDQKEKEAKFLKKCLADLQKRLDKLVSTVAQDLSEAFDDNIYDKYPAAIAAAVQEAVVTCANWGAPRGDGDYCWVTYKAIYRRDGNYSNGQGPHDWNTALSEPMIKHLAGGWERMFSRCNQAIFSSFATESKKTLHKFHKEVSKRARKSGAAIAGLPMLKQQINACEAILKDLGIITKEVVNTEQKEINRTFVPVITKAMHEAYQICTDEAGPGSYMCMKSAMNSHVATARSAMFQDSTAHLDGLAEKVETIMADKADEVFIAVKRDYTQVLGEGKSYAEGEIMPRWERMMRKDALKIIEGAEGKFERLVQDIEDEDEDLLMDTQEAVASTATDTPSEN
ncbi:hypothetical protein MMC25_006566 [Agyrium rufum]|nr:hypothetical protein [Agyrium rufum]